MPSNKTDISERYKALPDEAFGQINPQELTDEGRAAYFKEKTRRSTPEYKEHQAQLSVEFEAAQEKRAALALYHRRLRRISSICVVITLLAMFVVAIIMPGLLPSGILFWMAIVAPLGIVFWVLARVIIRPSQV